MDRFFKLVDADAAAHKIPDDYDFELADKVKELVKKTKRSTPVVADTKDDSELEKSVDMERVLVDDSLNILLGYELGLTDIDYMLELVDVNG